MKMEWCPRVNECARVNGMVPACDREGISCRSVCATQVKQLGVSNHYELARVQALWRDARIKPAVIQNRFYADSGTTSSFTLPPHLCRQMRAFCLCSMSWHASSDVSHHACPDCVCNERDERRYNNMGANVCQVTIVSCGSGVWPTG